MGLRITPHSLELPARPELYETRELARAVSDTGEEFNIVFGLSRALAEELRRHSCDQEDAELMKGTSDRARFCDGAYEDWFQKERYAFALTKEGALAAVIWFGPSALPEVLGEFAGAPADTLALRSYLPFRGKGLMTDFSRFVLAAHARLRPGRTLWLQTNADNAAGIRLYQKLGFVERGTLADNGRIVMIQS